MKKVILFISILFILPFMARAEQKPVVVYYFYSSDCTASAKMTPFLDDLASKNQLIDLRKYESEHNDGNADFYKIMGLAYGQYVKDVPAVFVGDSYIPGYDPTTAKTYIEYCLSVGCASPLDKLKTYQESIKNNLDTLKYPGKDWKKIIVGWTVILLIFVIFIWIFIKFFKFVFKKARKVASNKE